MKEVICKIFYYIDGGYSLTNVTEGLKNWRTEERKPVWFLTFLNMSDQVRGYIYGPGINLRLSIEFSLHSLHLSLLPVHFLVALTLNCHMTLSLQCVHIHLCILCWLRKTPWLSERISYISVYLFLVRVSPFHAYIYIYIYWQRSI